MEEIEIDYDCGIARLEDCFNNDMDDANEVLLKQKLETKTLSDEEKRYIGKTIAESMECGACCFYHWMDERPKLDFATFPVYSVKRQIWNMIPNLTEMHRDYYGDENVIECERDAYEDFEWTLMKFGPYYVLEAYYSH